MSENRDTALSETAYDGSLSLWQIDRADTVVAWSQSDALAVWEGHTGENRQDAGECRQIAAGEPVTVIDELPRNRDRLPTPEGYERTVCTDGQVETTATAAAWAKFNGRGFLCSTEW